MVKQVNAIQTIDTSNLVKKLTMTHKLLKLKKKIIDHDHSNKYITTQEFNKLPAENFAARLKQANLSTKAGINDFAGETDFVNLLCKITSNKTKNVEVEKKLTDLKNKVTL